MQKSVLRSVRGVTLCSLAACRAFVSTNRARAAIEFTITDLGTLGSPYVQSIPTSINNSGQVVGWCKTNGSILEPFLYSNGVMTDLGSFGTGSYTEATGINDSGKIIATGFPGGGVDQEASSTRVVPFLPYLRTRAAQPPSTALVKSWADSKTINWEANRSSTATAHFRHSASSVSLPPVQPASITLAKSSSAISWVAVGFIMPAL